MIDNEVIEAPSNEGGLIISKDEIQEILLSVYKETGRRISPDDPVMAVAVSSRLFVERLSDIIKSDIEACYAGWERFINESELKHLERVSNITNAVNSIEKESQAHIVKLSELVVSERRTINEECGRAKESFNTEARRVVAEIKDELKKQTEGYRPPKTSTLIGYAFAGALALSAAFTGGAYFYIHEKANADLNSLMPGMKKLIAFTEEKITELPANKQKAAKKELDRILN